MDGEREYSFSAITSFGERRKQKYLELIFRNVLPEIGPPATLLEVGPGRGEFAAVAEARGFSYVGIEPSEVLSEELRSKGLSILKGSLPTIELSDESVALIYSYDVVEHLDNYSTVLEYFREAYRVLRPGGYIVTIAPNAETVGNLFWLYEYQHEYMTTIDRICSLLKDSHLEVTRSFAFLTELGLLNGWIARAVDRILAHTVLLLARNSLVTAMMRACLGRNLVSKIHKNLFDHFVVIARRP